MNLASTKKIKGVRTDEVIVGSLICGGFALTLSSNWEFETFSPFSDRQMEGFACSYHERRIERTAGTFVKDVQKTTKLSKTNKR